MKRPGWLKRVLWGSAFLTLALWFIFPNAGPAAPAGASVNVQATFANAYGGKVPKIIGGPYSGRDTGGILQIGRKFGTLDLRFNPGSSPLIMALDEKSAPGTCLPERALPDSPFNISNLSVFSYKEVFLAEPCSEGAPVPGYGTSATYLNLLGMADGQSSYIQVHVRFEVTGFPDYFVIRHNKTDVIESEFVGIVKVVASDNNTNFPGVDHWEFSSMACPLSPVLLGDEANIYQTYPTGKRSSGSCSHGSFIVPFVLVLDRI